MTKKKQKFEDDLIKLEEISELLESEEVSLEDSIELYKEGMKLSKKCYETLKKAELKITKLNEELEEEFQNEEED